MKQSMGLQGVDDSAPEQHGVIVIQTPITITNLTPTIHRTVTGGAGAKLQEYHLDSESDKDDADLGPQCMILVTQVMAETAGKSSPLCVKMPKDMTNRILKFKGNCGVW